MCRVIGLRKTSPAEDCLLPQRFHYLDLLTRSILVSCGGALLAAYRWTLGLFDFSSVTFTSGDPWQDPVVKYEGDITITNVASPTQGEAICSKEGRLGESFEGTDFSKNCRLV